MRSARYTEKAHVVSTIPVNDYDLKVGPGDVLLADNELGIVLLAAQDIGNTGLEQLALYKGVSGGRR